MSDPDTPPLNRRQLSLFLPTPDLIRAFEALLNDVRVRIPGELDGIATEATGAAAAAGSALAQLAEVANALSAALLAPVRSLEPETSSYAAPVNAPDSHEWYVPPYAGQGDQQLITLDVQRAVRLNLDGGATLIGSTFTSSGNGKLQVREQGNEYILALKNAASKEWVHGVNGTTYYLRNVTDGTTAVQIGNAGAVGLGAAPAELLTMNSASSEYAASWTKTGANKWALGSYAGGAYVTNATAGIKHLQMLDTGETYLYGGGALALQVQTTLNAVFFGTVTHSDTNLIRTRVALGNGAAAAAGTLGNAPVAGNPTKWVPINDNGTTRYIPAW